MPIHRNQLPPQPFAWKDRPALMEHLFPVQKISAESYKEQMAGSGKTLTALGSYWKGRKPLFLNKACIIGCLMPTSEDALQDLKIFEMLMGMDEQSLLIRQKKKTDSLPFPDYKSNIDKAKRCEEMGDAVHAHIWDAVNAHLGTCAHSFPELVEQMGIARFGHRPRLADVFCGSGQIPFEAARLGCDVYASDLNPIACMLTWGAFNIVGAPPEKRVELEREQQQLAEKVQAEIDALGVEEDGQGWRAKVFLYCVEVTCPESGWKVPLLPSLIISKGYQVIAELVPLPEEKRYHIEIRYLEESEDLATLDRPTVQKGQLVHSPDGITVYRTSIKSIRGDYKVGKENRNRLRLWEKSDFVPRPEDIFQERLYCIQWMRLLAGGNRSEYDFRTVTAADLEREQTVIDYIGERLADWQDKGYVPDMVIEKGYNTDQPIRERGWTHWHHLFNARQLLVLGIINSNKRKMPAFLMTKYSNNLSRLCTWETTPARVNSKGKQVGGASNNAKQVFTNQALNTMYNYGCRSTMDLEWKVDFKRFPIPQTNYKIETHSAELTCVQNDIFITDPPYGDAVKYEEITEFFIAWLRKNPPKEFADWTWDSRRALAIKGEDDDFRRSMIRAYRRTAELMPDNGIQVIMFTHQSGSIWADMANIIWASGLQVTAAWYVVTETDSALRTGSNVKGTVLLVLRKRQADLSSFRDDLAWEIEAAVKEQVESLMGLDQTLRQQGSEGLYTDADLHMAGYAAALKVLTAYAHIDGKDMVVESEAPRVKGRKSFVEELIEFGVQSAVQFLVPVGFDKAEWRRLQPVERYYLKMLELENQGNKTLDNYQNLAKAFKIRHFDQLMSEHSKANAARLKLSTEFRNSLMTGEAEIAATPLRMLLYALHELSREAEIDDVLLHLMENLEISGLHYTQYKPILEKMADYIATKREGLPSTKTFKPDTEAANARILAEAIRNQRL